MRSTLCSVALLLAPAVASAGGLSRVYLVPALTECLGPATCSPRTFESTFTFESIVLLSSASKYTSPTKPSLQLVLHGVRDGAGALFTGDLSAKVVSGRVSLPGFGTFPDGSPLTDVPAVPIHVTNGNGHVAYKSATPIPAGTITNGGGVIVRDPDGKSLAVTGSQSKP